MSRLMTTNAAVAVYNIQIVIKTATRRKSRRHAKATIITGMGRNVLRIYSAVVLIISPLDCAALDLLMICPSSVGLHG